MSARDPFEAQWVLRRPRGKHRPSTAHYRISQTANRPSQWQVLKPHELVSGYGPTPALFDTFEEACAYTADRVQFEVASERLRKMASDILGSLDALGVIEQQPLTNTDGKPCWWCNKPLFRNPERNYDRKSLHADHSKSRALYGNTRTVADRLLHDTCNKQRGDGTRDHLRPALQHADNTQEHPLGVLAMEWPE